MEVFIFIVLIAILCFIFFRIGLIIGTKNGIDYCFKKLEEQLKDD